MTFTQTVMVVKKIFFLSLTGYAGYRLYVFSKSRDFEDMKVSLS